LANVIAGVYGLCTQMNVRNQEFTNFELPNLRDELLQRTKLVWCLSIETEKILKQSILEFADGWKKEGKNAIKFELHENWASTLK
jgi:hypothetical protein